MEMQLGVLGGSFDPIHHGHLAIAHEVAWALGLTRVLLVPTAQQPLKRQGHGASAAHRLAMVELACANDPLLEPCAIEVERPGPSYTVDTLSELRQRFGTKAVLWFVLGADALGELPRWYRAADLLQLCRFAAVGRPGASVDLAAVERELPGISARLTVVAGPGLEISGTELRRRLAAGQPVRYQLPDVVVDYIRQHQLYV